MGSDAARDDDRAARAAMLALGALVAQQIAGKAARDALFLTAFDVRLLPWAMGGASLLSSVAALFFARALASGVPSVVVSGAVAANALLLLAEWWMGRAAPALLAAVFYLHMALFGPSLVSGLWSLVNERFDPRAARRAVGRIGAGASVGGLLGGLLALGASRVLPVGALLLAMSLLNLLALRGVRALRAGRGEAPAQRTDLLAGLRVLRGSSYLRDLALFVALAAAVETVLDYLLSAQVVASGRKAGDLLAFFALFHTGVSLLGFVVQAGLARRALEAFGLAGTAAFQPATVALTSLAGAFAPRLATCVVARGAAGVLQNSLHRSAYELFYTPLLEGAKRSAKAVVDVSCDKLGSTAGGLVALAAVALVPSATAPVLFAAVFVAALGSLALSRRLHTGYVGALAQSLRSGSVHLDEEEVRDGTTRFTMSQATFQEERARLLRGVLPGGPAATGGPVPRGDEDPLLRAVRDLGSPDPQVVRAALEQASPLGPELVGHAIPLLGRNDVFLEALRALREAAPKAVGQLVDALLDPARPLNVRRRLPRVLRACPTERAASGLVLGLQDPAFEVRYECAAALARMKEKTPALQMPASILYGQARNELLAWEPGDLAGEPARRRFDHLFNLLAPVCEREPLRVALWALREGSPMRGTALEYLENVLPEEVRRPLFGAVGASLGPGEARRPRAEVEQEQMRSSGALPRKG